MEDLFDTFSRLTELRTRKQEYAPTSSKYLAPVARSLSKKIKRSNQKRTQDLAPEIFNDVLQAYDFDSDTGKDSKWFDLDHAVATGIERRMGSSFKSSETDELDFSPGPLEFSEDELSTELTEKTKV
jgi:hypothetical protein